MSNENDDDLAKVSPGLPNVPDDIQEAIMELLETCQE
jgi:hypothetical protein